MLKTPRPNTRFIPARRHSIFRYFCAILLGACLSPSFAHPPPPVELRPQDAAIWEHSAFQWNWLETEHVVVFYHKRMFADRVARLAEQFYEVISTDLPNLPDRVSPRKSPIFIFRDAGEWEIALAQYPGVEPWAVSFVSGNTMYLQERGASTSDKMSLLAHEMTHLVMNRFVTTRLPLWLNEGLAEYYGEFAFRRARGMGQGRRGAFPPLRNAMPLEELFNAKAYPASAGAVSLFYTTSKYMAGFLLVRLPRDKWDVFFQRVLDGGDAVSSLLDTYGWASIDDCEREFAKFIR